MKYTHIELDQEHRALAGYYTPHKEVRLQCNGREVLYVTGQAVIESSCCGAGSYAYALVPGYIVGWQQETNEQGLPVSEVEPVSDKKAQLDIRMAIEEAEHVLQVEFW